MSQVFKIIAVVIFVVLPLVILLGAQFGLFSGTRPSDLGLKNGMLKPPNISALNVVLATQKNSFTPIITSSPQLNLTVTAKMLLQSLKPSYVICRAPH